MDVGALPGELRESYEAHVSELAERGTPQYGEGGFGVYPTVVIAFQHT